MRTLEQTALTNISGGTTMTCKEALMAMEQDGSHAYLKFCTKAQFTVFALAVVDAMFAPETMRLYASDNFEEEDTFTLKLIESLDI